MVEAAAFEAGGTFGLSLVGWEATAAAFVANYAISVQVNRMFGEKPPSQTDQGTRQQVPPNTANALPIVYGDAYLGGTFVDAAITTDQKVMYYVMAVSCISPTGTFTFDQTKMYYGDRLITFGTGPNVASLTDQAGNVDTTIANNLQIYLYTSSASGVITNVNTVSAPSAVMGSGSGLPSANQWTGTRQMNGLAFAIVRLNYSREAQTTSMQPITFKVTQNLGGLDRARPGDVWYDYITNPYYGGAINSAYVDTTTRDDLNTYSDQTITYTPSGGGTATQRRYKINGVVNAGETVLSNIDKILTACDSWMAYSPPTGKWSVIVNKAEATSYAFNDNNIIGELRVSATDITSSVNIVESKFPNSDNKDQTAYIYLDLAVLNPSLLYPNEPANKASLSLDLVNDNVQASYLSNRILEQAREDLIVSFSTTYYGIQVDAGNVISVTNSSYGWTNKLFRVVRVNEISLPDGTLGAKIEASEYNAQVYDDSTVTAFTPAPNSGLPSPVYFSALQAPTVTGFPTASSPTFSVSCYIPITGRVTFGTLFYTTVATPANSDWKQLDFAQTANSQPVTNSTVGTPQYYVFSDEKLAAGTYYFAYSVGNETSQSGLSALSTAFVWAPVAPAGLNNATVYLYNKNTSTTPPALFSGTFTYTFATGVLSGGTFNGWAQTPPSIAAGEYLFVSLATASSTAATDTIATSEFSTPRVMSGTGTAGSTGPRSSFIYFYYNTAQGTAPTAPTTSQVSYNFSTNTASTTASGWTTSFTPSSLGTTSANNKYWAISVTFSEATYGGSQNTPVITGPFNWENFNGLVTFTNLSQGKDATGAVTTYIDGGTITTNTLLAQTIKSNAPATYNTYATFGLGVSTSAAGWLSAATFASTNFSVAGAIAINTAAGPAILGATTSTVDTRSAIVGVGGANSDASTYRNLGAIGAGDSAGIFQTAGTGNVAVGPATADIRLAYYTGGTSYAYYVYSGAAYPFTAGHDALQLLTESLPEIGDLMVDVALIAAPNVSDAITEMTVSSYANEKGIIGVYTGKTGTDFVPASLAEYVEIDGVSTVQLKPEYADIYDTYRCIGVNAIGEGKINVCGQGGDIEIGDFIVSSDMAGKGMKQTDDVFHSYTVAKARQSVTFSSPDEVKQIACIYMGG